MTSSGNQQFRSIREYAAHVGWTATRGEVEQFRPLIVTDPLSPGAEVNHFVERHEADVRRRSVTDWGDGVALSLDAFELWIEAYSGEMEFNERFGDPQQKEAASLSLSLLGIAGMESKIALDLLATGYYHAASGVQRSMLEAHYRSIALQLFPPLARKLITHEREQKRERFYWPDDSELKKGLNDHDQCAIELTRHYIRQMNFGSHASYLGTATQWSDDSGATMQFSPVYRANLFRYGLEVQGLANGMMLGRVGMLSVQTPEWIDKLGDLVTRFAEWSNAHPAD